LMMRQRASLKDVGWSMRARCGWKCGGQKVFGVFRRRMFLLSVSVSRPPSPPLSPPPPRFSPVPTRSGRKPSCELTGGCNIPVAIRRSVGTRVNDAYFVDKNRV
jgi:hypothetical protein